MSDCKVIVINAVEHSPTIDIKDKVARVDTTILTGTVTSPSLVTSTSNPCIDVSTTNLGDPFKIPEAYGYFFSDEANVLEALSKSISTSLLDSLSSIQEQISKSVATSLTDVTESVLDAPTFIVNKSLTEDFSVSDTVFLEVFFNRSVQDDLFTGDLSTRQIQPFKSEVLTLSETKFEIDFTKVFAELAQQSDFPAVTLTKPFTEDKTVSDDSYREVLKFPYEIKLADDDAISFDATAHLYDLVDATDDFLGEANIDDDQSAQVTKVLSNSVSFSDVLNRIVDYERIFTDQGLTTDVLNTSVQSFRIDNTSLFDAVSTVFDAVREFSDLTFSSDVLTSKAIGSVVSDQTTHTDSLVFSTNTHLSDVTLGLTEALSFDVTTNLLDSATSTDALTFNTAINLADSVTVTDFAIESLRQGRLASDSSLTTDITVFATNKGVLDTVTLGDSGTIHTQDYFLEDYVEFGYVGSIYTF